jgi:hypothetical protein
VDDVVVERVQRDPHGRRLAVCGDESERLFGGRRNYAVDFPLGNKGGGAGGTWSPSVVLSYLLV